MQEEQGSGALCWLNVLPALSQSCTPSRGQKPLPNPHSGGGGLPSVCVLTVYVCGV